MRYPTTRILAVAAPILALLVTLLCLAMPSLQPYVLPVGSVVSLLAVAVSGCAVLSSDHAKGWVALGLSMSISGLLLAAVLRSLARPLSFPVSEVLAAVVVLLLATAVWLVRRPEMTARVLVVLAAAFSCGLATASGFSAGVDFLGVTLWSALSLALGLAISLVLSVSFFAFRPARPRALGIAASAFALSVAALVREYSWLEVDELLTPERLATLQSVAWACALIVAVSSVVALVPSSALKWRWARALVALPLAALFVVSSPSASASLAEPTSGNLGQIKVATPSDVALSQRMLGVAGAGPREEFRGMTFEQCDDINSRDCFITYYDDFAVRDGVAAAVADIVSKTKENKGVTFGAHCHQVVHNLGQLAFEISADFTDAANIDPQVCGTGYTHGLWEQQFVALGDDVLFRKTATLCTELNMVTPWYNWTCSHIMGHIMVTRLMNNPGKAVEYCNRVQDTQSITDCQAGGWMNFFQDDVVIAKMDKEGSFKDLFSVCYGASTEVKFFCYQELFPVIYPLAGGSDYLAAQACLEYAEPDQFKVRSGPGREPWDWDVSYRDRCIQGLARGVLVASFEDYRKVGPRCLSMPEAAHDPCLTSAAASVVLNTGSTAAAFQLCRLVKDAPYRSYCYFWAKHSRKLLANGPNNQNLPGKDEIRLPEEGRRPGEPVTPPFTVPSPSPSSSQVGSSPGRA